MQYLIVATLIVVGTIAVGLILYLLLGAGVVVVDLIPDSKRWSVVKTVLRGVVPVVTLIFILAGILRIFAMIPSSK